MPAGGFHKTPARAACDNAAPAALLRSTPGGFSGSGLPWPWRFYRRRAPQFVFGMGMVVPGLRACCAWPQALGRGNATICKKTQSACVVCLKEREWLAPVCVWHMPSQRQLQLVHLVQITISSISYAVSTVFKVSWP